MSYECVCDGDHPEYFTRRRIKAAAKQHKCDECRRIIHVGESYDCDAGKWDGQHSTIRVCIDCAGLREWAKISVPCFCWSYGDMLHDIREMVEEVRKDVPGFFFEYGRLVIAIRRRRAKVDT